MLSPTPVCLVEHVNQHLITLAAPVFLEGVGDFCEGNVFQSKVIRLMERKFLIL